MPLEFCHCDNYIVGAIIYAIIIVIQLVVITSGASRVSGSVRPLYSGCYAGQTNEYRCRFECQQLMKWRQRKEERTPAGGRFLVRDGAMKFVKGCVAGIIITLINFIGGIAIMFCSRVIP